eukprot:180034_1
MQVLMGNSASKSLNNTKLVNNKKMSITSDAINSENQSKTAFPNNKKEFHPFIHETLMCCQLVVESHLNEIIDLIYLIAEYSEPKPVLFGDIITFKRFNTNDTLLNNTKFQIVKYSNNKLKDIAFNGNPVHYGEDFKLMAVSKNNKYLQRTRQINDDRNSVHKTIRFNVGLVELSNAKQTVQFDIAKTDVMGSIVRYDNEKIGITFGGNFEIKHSNDHKNPNNNFRTFMTLRAYETQCVVSWFGTDEQLIIE